MSLVHPASQLACEALCGSVGVGPTVLRRGSGAAGAGGRRGRRRLCGDRTEVAAALTDSSDRLLLLAFLFPACEKRQSYEVSTAYDFPALL